MTLAGQFGLSGVPDVIANLERIVAKVEKVAAAKAVDEQADRLVVDIQAETPVESGAARGSVHKAEQTDTYVIIRAGGQEAPYFPLIEWGGTHNRQPAAPFRKALERRRLVMVKETKASIRKSVPELGK